MKDIIIIYASKSGHTKQYVQWLQNELDAEVCSFERADASALSLYKLVVFASAVYNDKLIIMDYIKKNLSAINTQRTMFLAVTWYSNGSEEAANTLAELNYPDSFKNRVPMFVLNSGIDKKKISPLDNVKLIAVQMGIEKRDGRTTDEINTLAILKGYCDETKKENLDPFIQKIKDFLNPPKPAAKPMSKPAGANSVPVSSFPPVQPVYKAAEPKPAPAVPPVQPAYESVPEPSVDAITAPIKEPSIEPLTVPQQSVKSIEQPEAKKKVLDLSDLKAGLAEFDISYKPKPAEPVQNNTAIPEPMPAPKPSRIPSVFTAGLDAFDISSSVKRNEDGDSAQPAFAQKPVQPAEPVQNTAIPEPMPAPKPSRIPSVFTAGLDAFDISSSVKRNEDGDSAQPAFAQKPVQPAEPVQNNTAIPEPMPAPKPSRISSAFTAGLDAFDISSSVKRDEGGDSAQPAFAQKPVQPAEPVQNNTAIPEPMPAPKPSHVSSTFTAGLDAFDISSSVKSHENGFTSNTEAVPIEKPATEKNTNSFSFESLTAEFDMSLKSKQSSSIFSKPLPPKPAVQQDSASSGYSSQPATNEVQPPKPTFGGFSKPLPPKPAVQQDSASSGYSSQPATNEEQPPKPTFGGFSKPLPPKPAVQQDSVSSGYSGQPANEVQPPKPTFGGFSKPLPPKPAVQQDSASSGYSSQPATNEVQPPKPPSHVFTVPSSSISNDIFDTIDLPDNTLDLIQDLDSPISTQSKPTQTTAHTHYQKSKQKSDTYNFTQLKADLEAAMNTKHEKKFITEPIDADAFFKKSKKNDDDIPGVMPEIKF